MKKEKCQKMIKAEEAAQIILWSALLAALVIFKIEEYFFNYAPLDSRDWVSLVLIVFLGVLSSKLEIIILLLQKDKEDN